VDELYAGLQKLGFSQYESRAYVALLKSPRVTGYELAKQSGVSQSKIYEVVDKLVQKELVVAIEEGGSVRYVPLDPMKGVDRYRHDYTHALDLVGERLSRLYDEESCGAAYVVTLQRSREIVAKTVEMVEAAQTEVLVMLWPEELPQVESVLRLAEARGVAIAMCVYGDAEPGVGAVYHHGLDDHVRRNQRGRRMVVVIDRHEALVSHFSESGDATAHWSTNLGFVQMSEDYVRHDIWNARMVQDFGSLIVEKYGPQRERLRDIFPPGPQWANAAGDVLGVNGAVAPAGPETATVP
jgi:sugar-specific transcriptional regulator TrmB